MPAWLIVSNAARPLKHNPQFEGVQGVGINTELDVKGVPCYPAFVLTWSSKAVFLESFELFGYSIELEV